MDVWKPAGQGACKLASPEAPALARSQGCPAHSADETVTRGAGAGKGSRNAAHTPAAALPPPTDATHVHQSCNQRC